MPTLDELIERFNKALDLGCWSWEVQYHGSTRESSILISRGGEVLYRYGHLKDYKRAVAWAERETLRLSQQEKQGGPW